MNGENTAIANGVATSAKLLAVEYNHRDHCGPVLDYGTGMGRNLRWLISKGVRVVGTDLDSQIERQKERIKDLPVFSAYDLPEHHYELILCSFVLNVIQEDSVKLSVLQDINRLLAGDGMIFLELRRKWDIDHIKCAEPCGDGVLCKRGYQEYVKPEKLERLASQAGLTICSVINNGLKYIVTLTRKGNTI